MGFLSAFQLQELFDGALHVLEYVGVEVHHDEARDILEKAGAWVDGLRVRFPSYLVKQALSAAPRSFTIYARDGNPKHNIRIGPGRAHFGPGPTPPNFTDIDTLERRRYVKNDAAIMIRDKEAAEKITRALADLINNNDRKETLSKNISKMVFRDAADKIADEIINLIEKK